MATVETRFTTAGVPETVGACDKVAKGFSGVSGAAKDTSSSLDFLKASVTSIITAFGAWKIADYVRDTALLSARYETLDVVMRVVGNNAGYTGQQMNAFEQGLQKQGIAMVEARQTLTQMASAHMDLSKSSELARIAQDAAVIGQINSSEAFERMITGIQQGEVEILKTLGLNVDFAAAQQRLASQLGKSTQSLTQVEKVQANMNATMLKGKDIAGVYDAAIVVSINVHKIFESLQAANTGNDPATSPTWWLDRGATNRWKMFDTLVNSQTEHAGDITFSLKITGRINSIALLNIYASSVRVIATDAVDGVVFDRTSDMRGNLGTIDWWSWFFESPEWDSEAVMTDLPMYSDITISVTLTNIGGVARCGACIVGLSKDLGDTQYGASVGIQDYSVKTRDTWGNYTVLERAYSKRANFTVNADNNAIDRLQALLARYRSVPILYIGAEEFGSTTILGFYKDFSVSIAYCTFSVCTIEIEGLI